MFIIYEMKSQIFFKLFVTIIVLVFTNFIGFNQNPTYPVVDTYVQDFYDNSAIITAPNIGQAFYGQDATYRGNQPSCTDNGDGTITDNATALML